LNKIKLIIFLQNCTVVTSEVLGPCVCTTCSGLQPGNAVTWSQTMPLRFNGHFPGEPGLAGVYWSKGCWRWRWQLEL